MSRALRSIPFFIILALSFIACNALPQQPSRPSVIIAAPPGGSVYTVGELVAVQSTSTDTGGIVRVDLLVDGVSVHQDPSPVSTGQQQYSLVQTWTADKAGQHNLIVRATNAQGITTDSGIFITVQEQTGAQPTTNGPTGTATSAAVPVATSALPPASATDVPAATATASETTNPVVTVVVTATPTETTASTSQPADTVTPSPTTTTAVACTDNSAFVADLTVPDGTNFSPNTPFTKSWRIQNNGTCAWQNYTLDFVSGPPLAAVTSFPVPATAAGASADIAITLTSPAGFGNYKGSWRLRNAAGILFGTSLTTVINVPNPNPVNPTAAACSGTPTIVQYTASASSITVGQSVTLTWVTTNADEVHLEGGSFASKVLPANGSYTDFPTANASYRLTPFCTSNGSFIHSYLTVTVTPAASSCSGQPDDFSFTATKSTISAGQSVTLNWGAVTNASIVSLNGGEFSNEGVGAPGSKNTSPTKTTTYTLTATCTNGGTRTKSVQVTVNGNPPPAACSNPTIGSFSVTPTSLGMGGSVTVKWSGVTGADKITLSYDGVPFINEQVGQSGSKKYTLAGSGAFRLEAVCSSLAQAVAKQVDVIVICTICAPIHPK